MQRTCRQVGLRPAFVHTHSLFRASTTRRAPRRTLAIQAVLPDTTTLAVTQQGAVFAVTLIAEGLYTRAQTQEDTPGRPSLLPIVASTLGITAALGLVNLGEQGQRLGLIVGGTTCAIILALSLKRCFDTKGDPRDWPGPKTWPIFISVGAFFATLVFFEALQYI